MTESKKEAYRKYLETAGVIDALTKVLVSLYEEPDKPKSAVDYVKTCLGAPTPQDFESVSAERDAYKKQLDEAQQLITDLQTKVQTLTESLALAQAPPS